jgi:hypothetical protein
MGSRSISPGPAGWLPRKPGTRAQAAPYVRIDLGRYDVAGHTPTARALATLPRRDWTVLHGVWWRGRRHATIDHLVIGPSGVFVIGAKHWSGSVSWCDDEVLRQDGWRREATIDEAVRAAEAVADLTGVVAPDDVRPVLSLVGVAPVVGELHGVLVGTPTNLADLLLELPAVLTREQRVLAALDLDASVRCSRLTVS